MKIENKKKEASSQLGKTKSGKPVYMDAANAAHANFTSDDHMEAYDLHVMAMHPAKNQGNAKMHSEQARIHWLKTIEGRTQQLNRQAAAEFKQKRMENEKAYDIMMDNKQRIYDGLMRLGHKYFDTDFSGFECPESINDIQWGVIFSADTTDLDEDYPEGETPLVDDAYYLGAVYNHLTDEVEELNGYRELEYEQITSNFVASWYTNPKNKGKYLVSFDATLDDISVII